MMRACMETPSLDVSQMNPAEPGKVHTIPLTAEAEAALDALDHFGAYGPFSTSTVRRAFHLACQRLHLSGIRPYDLRHSFGTALYAATGNTRIVKEFLGHSRIEMDRAVHPRGRPGLYAGGDSSTVHSFMVRLPSRWIVHRCCKPEPCR